MQRRRVYTIPLKEHYSCALCAKSLLIRTCERVNLLMYGCKYIECTHSKTPYEGWPKKFEWVTSWFYDDEDPASSPLLSLLSSPPLPWQLPPATSAVAETVRSDSSPPRGPSTVRSVSASTVGGGSATSEIIDLTLPPGSDRYNPIVL
ncbi:hypothetical protein C8Q76DRAFT_795190 [Earliella scabrosa]|nr:hypothetical protein C8Q76DRAFT_795190 [Earliella scabrosa]